MTKVQVGNDQEKAQSEKDSSFLEQLTRSFGLHDHMYVIIPIMVISVERHYFLPDVIITY